METPTKIDIVEKQTDIATDIDYETRCKLLIKESNSLFLWCLFFGVSLFFLAKYTYELHRDVTEVLDLNYKVQQGNIIILKQGLIAFIDNDSNNAPFVTIKMLMSLLNIPEHEPKNSNGRAQLITNLSNVNKKLSDLNDEIIKIKNIDSKKTEAIQTTILQLSNAIATLTNTLTIKIVFNQKRFWQEKK